MPNIAVFDLDYTLTKRGTWGRFVWSTVKGKPWLWIPLLASAGITQFRYKRGHLPRIRVKQAMMRWAMVGKPRAEVEAMALAFAKQEVETGLRPKALGVLEKHRQAGDTLIIVSAAVDIIVKPIADLLKIDYWLATDMKWTDGRLAETFASKNCYGEEKVVRLEGLFQQYPELKQSDTIITFYSDSYSDIALMSYCDVGVAVNPDKRLRAATLTNGWDVQDWGR